ncbi:chromosomal replication initiator protein DnaA [Ktedonosporobacter rubrisoli]|uniref:Chromosomal replication initiator protein DnaA n=1 Tax=Ktedonosporobacter rubrisoli TaxID=2509675 RepID=A0A4P6JY63_KTERU|nr:chromosomal replication initiator protein DnaA [Ktedonosporobacter rubrisoli]QBD79966.1 chromosomal replication initiator protein DnaA [Ktedonosporobacter rubrisoli]
MNTATIWRTTLERLEQTAVDADSKAWLQDAHLASVPYLDDGDIALDQADQGVHFTLQVPNTQACNVINNRWRPSLEEILTEITGQVVTLSVSSEDKGLPAAQNISTEAQAATQRSPAQNNYTAYFDISPHQSTQAELQYMTSGSMATLEDWDNEQRANMLMHNRLNPRYTFEAFIVGNSNRLAHAASLAVAEAPGESYNPLFLYGGVGLGKTHLLHAIGHLGVQTGLAVLYVSSEQFTNEIVNAIRYRTTEEFRAKYRSVDILLVDDIQFIAGKESTEEEFFHTFNSLHEMSKQIVICSDRPPKAIVSLEERLRSRFEWGLIADIQPPDLETRMAILRVKSDLLNYPIPDEIIAYIASRVQTNIRELEGCLNRLMAYQQLHHTDLTLDVARAAMSSLGNDNREASLNGRQIAEAVADYYHTSLEAMRGKQRDKHIVMPRQIAMYLIRQETQASLLEIGQFFGGRDHSTVLHACEKIERTLNLNPGLRREIIAIREQLLRE